MRGNKNSKILWKFIRKIDLVTSILDFSDQILLFLVNRVWVLPKVIFVLEPKSETSTHFAPALPLLIHELPFWRHIRFTLLIFITRSHPLFWINNRECDRSLGSSVVKHFRTLSQGPPLYGHIFTLSPGLQSSQKCVTPVPTLIRSHGPLT